MRRAFSKKSQKKRALLLIALFLLCCVQFRTCFVPTPLHLPFTLHFAEDYVIMEPGERHSLKMNGLHLIATFRSSRSKVASVTQTGVIHAWKCGRCVITATIHNRGGKKIRCLVYVTKLNHRSLTLFAGQTKRLRLCGVYFGVAYKSSDPKIAAVSRFGKVTAVSSGTATISATVRGKAFQCKVTVK